jgi:alkylhydroperoxidase family enzyme
MRLDMIEPPYDTATTERLGRLLPPGMEPLHLVRQLLRYHPDLTEAVMILPVFLHGPDSRLDAHTRELVVGRTLARCGNEYEWAVHGALAPADAGLSGPQRAALAAGPADDPVWDERDRDVLRAVDELHDTAALSDATWELLRRHLDGGQALAVAVVAGWYRATSLLSNVLQPPAEEYAARFPLPATADVRS